MSHVTSSPSPLRRKLPHDVLERGFSLIDVSLGIIAGIGLMIGSITAYHQVSGNQDLSEATRLSIALSYDIGTTARRLMRYSDLPGDVEGEFRKLDLSPYSVDQNHRLTFVARTPLEGPDLLILEVTGLSANNCLRAIRNPAGLGYHAQTADCLESGSQADKAQLSITFAR